MTTAVVCAALLCALVLLLGANVSRWRGASRDQFPTAPDDPLFVAVRAHGNAAEYNPALALLVLLVASRQPGDWAQALYLLTLAVRLLHPAALLLAADMSRNTALRSLAAAGTYLTGLGLCGTAVVLAVP